MSEALAEFGTFASIVEESVTPVPLLAGVVEADGVTGAAVSVLGADGQVLDSVGWAFKDDQDEDDPLIGRELAMGRALRQLGQRLVRRAEGRVRHADEVRAARQRPKPVTLTVRIVADTSAFEASMARVRQIIADAPYSDLDPVEYGVEVRPIDLPVPPVERSPMEDLPPIEGVTMMVDEAGCCEHKFAPSCLEVGCKRLGYV